MQYDNTMALTPIQINNVDREKWSFICSIQHSKLSVKIICGLHAAGFARMTSAMMAA